MKKIFLLFLIVLASGCATPSYQLTDVRVNALAVADVLSAKCQEISPNTGVYTDYRMAASKLLSVADLNAPLYNESYREVTGITESKTTDEMRADCEEYIPKINAMIPEMRKDYDAYVYIIGEDKRRQAEAWANALELFAAAANEMGQVANSYNYQFIPIPSGRVTFGQSTRPNTGYNHYLVNTPHGTQQCHVSGSGYIFCN